VLALFLIKYFDALKTAPRGKVRPITWFPARSRRPKSNGRTKSMFYQVIFKTLRGDKGKILQLAPFVSVPTLIRDKQANTLLTIIN